LEEVVVDIMRLLAIISTGLFLLIICLMLIGQFFEFRIKKNTYNLLAILFTLVIAFMAYGSYFGKGSDLKRYYEIMQEMKGRSFAWAQENGFYKNTILTNFLFWAIAQTDDYQLLPMITASITACSLCYIILSESRRKKLNSCVTCVYILQIVAIGTIALILTAVRQNVMAALFAVAVYRDFILKKKNLLTVFIYVCTCLIHVAAIFLIVIRLCAFIKSNIKYLFLFWSLLIPLLEPLLGNSDIFGESVGKLFVYKGFTESGVNIDIRSILAQTGLFLVIAFRFYDLKFSYRRTEFLKNKMGYYNFIETFLIFTIGAIPVMHLFLRQITALTYITLPLLIDHKEIDKKNFWMYSLLGGTFLCLGLFAYQFVFAINYWEFV
jgi:hypothetical protein